MPATGTKADRPDLTNAVVGGEQTGHVGEIGGDRQIRDAAADARANQNETCILLNARRIQRSNAYTLTLDLEVTDIGLANRGGDEKLAAGECTGTKLNRHHVAVE